MEIEENKVRYQPHELRSEEHSHDSMVFLWMKWIKAEKEHIPVKATSMQHISNSKEGLFQPLTLFIKSRM